MHILYLHQYYCPPGGSGNDRSRAFAREWVKAGHQVTVLTSPAYFPAELKKKVLQNSLPTLLEWEGVKVIVLPVDYDHQMQWRDRLRAFLRFYRQGLRHASALTGVDRIYASSTPLSVGEMGRKLARRLGIPFVYETVDVWPDVPIGMGLIRNRMVKAWLHRRAARIYASAQHIVALSEGMKAQIASHGVPQGKITVVPNGTDVDQFAFAERREGNQVNVLYAGTMGLANGVTQIVEAARLLHERGNAQVHFTLIGDGNAASEVKALAAKYSLPNLSLKGMVPKEEMQSILAQAHIGLVCFAPFAVLEANSANKFFDYLASGLPVVINYRGWQAEVLNAEGCGFSCDQGDVPAFAEAIETLAQSAGMRREMGAKGRALAVAKWDRRMLARQVLGILSRGTGL